LKLDLFIIALVYIYKRYGDTVYYYSTPLPSYGIIGLLEKVRVVRFAYLIFGDRVIQISWNWAYILYRCWCNSSRSGRSTEI